MAPGYLVRRLEPGEWAAWKTIRLAALRTDPLAFGSTLEREEAYPDERWQDRARRGAGPGPDSAFVATDSNANWVGMGGTFVAERTMHVYGMWVEPPHRGRGVGRAILEAIVSLHGREAAHLPLELQVNPEQTAARGLYERMGFRATGEFESLGHHAPAVVERMVWRGSR